MPSSQGHRVSGLCLFPCLVHLYHIAFGILSNYINKPARLFSTRRFDFVFALCG